MMILAVVLVAAGVALLLLAAVALETAGRYMRE